MADETASTSNITSERASVDPIDEDLVELYTDLIRKTSIHGETFAVYVYKLGDPLPSLSYDYSDDLTVCSSVVLKLDNVNWVFVSNAKVSIRSPNVNLYCSSSIQFMNPLPDDFKNMLMHFFPCKDTLKIHYSLDVDTFDSNGCVTALLNLYSSIITDRILKFNIMSTSKMSEQITSAILRSVDEKKLFRFTDNEFYSIFQPTYDLSDSISYSIRYLSLEDLKKYRVSREKNRKIIRKKRKSSADSSSDDDFETRPPFGRKRRTNSGDSDSSEIPRFVSPNESEKAKSRSRLESMQGLLQDQNCIDTEASDSSDLPKSPFKTGDTMHVDAIVVEHSTVDWNTCKQPIDVQQRASDTVNTEASDSSDLPKSPLKTGDTMHLDAIVVEHSTVDWDTCKQPIDVEKTAGVTVNAMSPTVPSASSAESTEDSSTALSRDQPVASALFGSFSHLKKVYQSSDECGLKSYKQKGMCRLKQCFEAPEKITRLLHYHCLMCNKYMDKDFQKRVLPHMLKCPSVNNFGDALMQPKPAETVSKNSSPTVETVGENSSPTVETGGENSSPNVETAGENSSPTVETAGENSSPTVETVGENSCPNVDTVLKNGSPAVENSSPSEAAPEKSNSVVNDLLECWEKKESCTIKSNRSKTKHWHCKICDSSHTSQQRMKEHLVKCKRKHNSTSRPRPAGVAKTCDEKDSTQSFQAELICPKSGTYLVRKAIQGPASPVHVCVSKHGWECTVRDCQDMYNFYEGSLNPSYFCEHALACVNRNLTTKSDLIDNVTKFDSFGKDDEPVILSFCKEAKEYGSPVIKEFCPTMADNSKTSRNIYYSVFAGTGVVKHYSLLRRVLVTYDKTTDRHTCECSTRDCIHRKIAVLVSQVNPNVKKERPEDQIDDEEVETAKAHMKYVLERKRIPFDVSMYVDAAEITEFSPQETRCHKCENVELEQFSVHNRGIIFSIDKKVTGVKVVTKHCPSCNFQYRYSEHTEGYFNYNNSSFFTISLMEQGVTAWKKNTPISSFLEIEKVRTKINYNIHLILNAVKAYMALKDLNLTENMSCNKCGDYPIHLSYDVIRSVCFDVEPSSIGKHQYDSFNEMYADCCEHDLARGYLNPKSCHFNSNMKHLSVKLSQTLPPLICPNNFGGLAPYTRQLLETDKAEEVKLPLERIEQLVKSKNAYKELKSICDKLKIETRGGKSQMMTRLIENEGNAEVYSVVRKKFTKITGKSGGILRAFCLHGNCYALKFLTLPESVADYTNVMTGFQVMPNFNFTDVAGVVPVHTNNHFPGLFRPFLGRIDDPEDPLSDMYKDGSKQAVYNYNTFTTAEIDRSKYNHYTAHPVSGLMEVLSLYDEFHESNHHGFDKHLRSLKSTNRQGMCNTSVSEQQNHVISLKKTFCNEMNVNQHIKFVTYVTCAHNKANNDKWKKKAESKSKQECKIDDLGFLVMKDVDKSTVNSSNFDTQLTSNLKSPHPVGVLQDPANDASALNSVVYALCHSHLADPILDSVECISHQLISLASGKAPYNQEVHFSTKKRVDKLMPNSAAAIDPLSILKVAFINDLVHLGVLLDIEKATSLNMGISLSHNLRKRSTPVDYAILYKTEKSLFFNGIKPHFDIYLRDQNVRYILSAFVSKAAANSTAYSCFCRYGDNVYEIQNTKITRITETAFLEFARSAEFVIFKLVTPLALDRKNIDHRPKQAGNTTDTTNTGDIFEFEPPPKRRKAGKQKITVAHHTNEVQRTWLSQSDTGRLDLYTEQYKICQSSSRWYDDIIINSYAFMCKQQQRSSFSYQDTCLTSTYSGGKLLSADNKFIQIMNPYNMHWFCASNALTFVNEPHVVEIYDSLKCAETLSSVRAIDLTTSQLILQLKPHTTVIRYMACQKQMNSYDCGPYALGFLWSLSKGHHPLQYEHLRGPMIRNRVRQSFIENRFIKPCTTPPKNYPRHVLKCFDIDPSTKRFLARV